MASSLSLTQVIQMKVTDLAQLVASYSASGTPFSGDLSKASKAQLVEYMRTVVLGKEPSVKKERGVTVVLYYWSGLSTAPELRSVEFASKRHAEVGVKDAMQNTLRALFEFIPDDVEPEEASDYHSMFTRAMAFARLTGKPYWFPRVKGGGEFEQEMWEELLEYGVEYVRPKATEGAETVDEEETMAEYVLKFDLTPDFEADIAAKAEREEAAKKQREAEKAEREAKKAAGLPSGTPMSTPSGTPAGTPVVSAAPVSLGFRPPTGIAQPLALPPALPSRPPVAALASTALAAAKAATVKAKAAEVPSSDEEGEEETSSAAPPATPPSSPPAVSFAGRGKGKKGKGQA